MSGNVARRRAIALAGHSGDVAAVRAALDDTDAHVRATALGALARADALRADDVAAAAHDIDPIVRRRAAEAATAAQPSGAAFSVLELLDDADATVVETAAWACGELAEVTDDSDPIRVREVVVDRLAQLTTGHEDALVREAAVAALGSIGDERGLAAILTATQDKPAVRRRAVLALAPFAGPAVDIALERAKSDRDWQVRQAAEDLTAPED